MSGPTISFLFFIFHFEPKLRPLAHIDRGRTAPQLASHHSNRYSQGVGQYKRIKVGKAFGDADTLILTTGIQKASTYDSVEIVGEDIHILVSITGLADGKKNIFFCETSKGNTPTRLCSPNVLENILCAHAFSGCDTTSSLHNLRKPKFIDKNIPYLRSSLELFKQENVNPKVLTCAEE